MFVEFQLSIEPLLTLVRNRFASTRICFSKPFEYKGTPVLLDHLEFGFTTLREGKGRSNPIFRTALFSEGVAGPSVELVQAISPVLKSVEDIKKAGTKPAAVFLNPEMKIVFRVRADVGGGVANLCLEYAALESAFSKDPSFGVLSSEVETVVGSISGLCTQIDLSALNSVWPGGLKIVNVGAAADWVDEDGKLHDASVISVRLQAGYASDDDLIEWGNFFRGRFTNRLQGQSWSLFIHQDILVSALETTFRTRLEASTEQFRLKEGPTAYWLDEVPTVDLFSKKPKPGPEYARVVLGFKGDAVKACKYGGLAMDVSIRVTTTLSFGVTTTNVLQTYVGFDWYASDGDVIVCSLAAGFSGSVLGMIIRGVTGGALGAIICAIAGGWGAL